MEWLNIYGLIFVVLMLNPNVIYALKCKDKPENKVNNKAIEITEQIGRFGCMAFMIFNIPKTGFGFSSDEAFAIYLIVNSVLVALYCMFWIVLRKRKGVFRALALSVIPSVIFLFSGIISHYVLLIISSLIFAPSHIYISLKNAK